MARACPPSAVRVLGPPGQGAVDATTLNPACSGLPCSGTRTFPCCFLAQAATWWRLSAWQRPLVLGSNRIFHPEETPWTKRPPTKHHRWGSEAKATALGCCHVIE